MAGLVGDDHADRHAEGHGDALDLERLADGGDQAGGDVAQHVEIAHPLDQDGELVAADAGGGVGVAHHVVDAVGDAHEHGVADVVAELVVDRLEPVEVEVEQGDGLVGALVPVQGGVELVVQQHPVGQARHVVVGRQVGQLVVGRLQVGDVAGDDRQRVERALGALLGQHQGRHRDEAALTGAEGELASPQALLHQHRLDHLVEELVGVGVEHVEQEGGRPVVGAVVAIFGSLHAEGGEGGVVDVADGAGAVGDQQEVRTGVDHAGQPVGPRPGGDLVGDVGERRDEAVVAALAVEHGRHPQLAPVLGRPVAGGDRGLEGLEGADAHAERLAGGDAAGGPHDQLLDVLGHEDGLPAQVEQRRDRVVDDLGPPTVGVGDLALDVGAHDGDGAGLGHALEQAAHLVELAPQPLGLGHVEAGAGPPAELALAVAHRSGPVVQPSPVAVVAAGPGGELEGSPVADVAHDVAAQRLVVFGVQVVEEPADARAGSAPEELVALAVALARDAVAVGEPQDHRGLVGEQGVALGGADLGGEVEDVGHEVLGPAARPVDRRQVLAQPEVAAVGEPAPEVARQRVALAVPDLLDGPPDGGGVRGPDEGLEGDAEQLAAGLADEVAQDRVGVEELAVDRPDADSDRGGVEDGGDPADVARQGERRPARALGHAGRVALTWLVRHDVPVLVPRGAGATRLRCAPRAAHATPDPDAGTSSDCSTATTYGERPKSLRGQAADRTPFSAAVPRRSTNRRPRALPRLPSAGGRRRFDPRTRSCPGDAPPAPRSGRRPHRRAAALPLRRGDRRR